MNYHRAFRLASIATLAAIALAACASHGPTTANNTPNDTPPAWQNAEQMVVVTSTGWDTVRGNLRLFERSGDGWKQIGEAKPVMLGRNGSAWGIGLHTAESTGPQKREGDGRNPAGVFAIGEAFGYARNARSGLRYRQMLASNYCMDVNGSPLYNQIVDSREVGEETVKDSTEPMRLDIHKNGDHRYKIGFVIEHNPGNISGMGSCIFAHLWGDPDKTTAGCTAMNEPVMRELLGWLDAGKHPVFVLLPDADYQRLQSSWQLPAPSAFR